MNPLELEKTLTQELGTSQEVANPTTSQVEIRGYDRYVPTPLEGEARDEALRSEIEAKQADLDALLVLRAKNVLVAHNFKPFDLSEGRTIEDYVEDAIHKELDAQMKTHQDVADNVLKEFIPRARVRENALPYDSEDYGPKDLSYLSVRADAHLFMAEEIDRFRSTTRAPRGEMVSDLQLMLPVYLNRAMPMAAQEIKSIIEDKEAAAKAKLKDLETTLSQFEIAAHNPGIDMDIFEKSMVKLKARVQELEAEKAELEAENARLNREIESRDFTLWEQDVSEENAQVVA